MSAQALPSSADQDPAAALARFVARCDRASIPDHILTRARHHVLDAAGIALATGGFDFAQRTMAAILDLSGPGDTPVIGFEDRLPSRDAALVNGLLCHGLDFDDTHLDSIVHPTASLFPCALSAAVREGASLEAFFVAFLAGLETAARIGSVAKGGFHQVGFHPTSVVGVFGCALAAGKLMGLDEAQLAQAQGIALSTAAGSMEFLADGAWNKRVHPGLAAQNGITAAGVARHGFVGIAKPYAGRFGLFRSYLGAEFAGCDLSRAAAGLFESWELERTAIKPYAACHFAHGAIDAALAVRAQAGDPDRIESARVLVPAGIVKTVCEPVTSKKRPQNDYDARFSIQYLVAAALRRGRLTLAELDDEALNDPTILRLCDKVDYAIDEKSRFPQVYSGEVDATLSDGSRISSREDANRGSAERPLSNEDIREKFRDNVAAVLSPVEAARLEAVIVEAPMQDSAATLAEALRGRRTIQ